MFFIENPEPFGSGLEIYGFFNQPMVQYMKYL